MSNVINEWITLSETKRGLNVQRKFAGMNALVNEDNTVRYCIISYYERLVAPDASYFPSKLKTYTIQDYPSYVKEVDGHFYEYEAVTALTQLITNVGEPFIVNVVNETLEDLTKLPINIETNYPLHRDTREFTEIFPEEGGGEE